MKNSRIGGQAVIEGIMMRNGDDYAVAVRKPDKEIEVMKEHYDGVIKSKVLKTTPFLRGVFQFVDSLVLGMKTLTFAASFFELEEEEQAKKEALTGEAKAKEERKEKMMMGVVTALSIVLAIGLFMLLPYGLAALLRKVTDSAVIIALFEGVLRIVIFIGYLVSISLMEDIKRVYMYHGAEHKCINCLETGHPLTVENVRKSSREHRRCGTSFLLYIIVISIVLFFFIRVESPLLRVGIRLLLVPVIASISYELIRLAGNSSHPIVRAFSKPGLMLQKLTTREPDDEMIEVGIAAVEAVFDWKQFLAQNFPVDHTSIEE